MIENAPERKADVTKFEERIARKRAELEKEEKRKQNLYEDFKDEILSRKEYLQLKAEYDRRIGEAERAITSYEQERKLLLENKSSLHEWIQEFKQYRNLRTLERNAAVVMIKQVMVYQADRIEILYQFEDELARDSEYVKACMVSGGKEAANG